MGSSKRLQGDLLLMAVAVIWGSAFVAQRVAAQTMGFFAFNGFRFLIGAAILAPIAFWGWRKNLSDPGIWKSLIMGTSMKYVVVAGCILFLASAFQQAGLEHTTAANAGFITSLYVILVPILAWLIFRQSVSGKIWLASGLAVVGAGLLSAGGKSLALNRGDGFELVGAFLWALHLIVVGLAATKLNGLRFSVLQFTIAGCLNIAASLVFERDIFRSTSQTWISIFYVGIFSTAVGYTLQVIGQKRTPPSDAAILLSLEAVFAALFGWILIQEYLDPIQITGCALILTSVILVQAKPGARQHA